MKTDLSRYVPVGASFRRFIKGYLLYLGFSVLYSFGFLIRFNTAYNHLYYVERGIRVLRPDSIISDFHELIDHFFIFFQLMIPLMILYMFFFYMSHYTESKSIYLMKRLPQKYELYVRCMTLPLIGIIITIITGFLLLMLYYLIYMNVTPTQCIPPDQWQKLWSVII